MNYSVRIWDETNRDNFFTMEFVGGFTLSEGMGHVTYDPGKMYEALDKLKEAIIED